jgi:hypothetical protein
MSSNCCGLSISYGNDEYRYADSFPIVKDYQLLVGDDPSDDSYIMSDGKELKVSDAIKSAETLYNEHISKLSDNEFTYKVIVHQYDDGTYGFEYDMEYSDKSGNIIASCLKTYPDANGFEDGTSPWIAENDCHGYIIDSSMSVYTYQETIPLKDTETDSGTKLLTYSSAINRISSTLAISKLYSVDIAALEYVITYPAESGLITKDDVTGECIDLDTMAYLHDDNRTMEVRPFWVFRNFEYNTTSEAYSGGCIMVDALNGNVYVH